MKFIKENWDLLLIVASGLLLALMFAIDAYGYGYEKAMNEGFERGYVEVVTKDNKLFYKWKE